MVSLKHCSSSELTAVLSCSHARRFVCRLCSVGLFSSTLARTIQCSRLRLRLRLRIRFRRSHWLSLALLKLRDCLQRFRQSLKRTNALDERCPSIHTLMPQVRARRHRTVRNEAAKYGE
jgi:hypothetical protein